MKFFTRSFILVLLLCLTPLSFAELELEIKLGRWQPDYSGDIGAGTGRVTFGNLGYDDFDHDSLMATLRHPIPLLPNLRLQIVEMESDGVSNIPNNFTLNGTTFTGGLDRVTSSMDLSFTDATLFYSPLSNWVTLDVGLTARRFDGSVTASGSVNNLSVTSEFDGWIPMLHGAVRFELPLTGFYLDASGNSISFDDNSINDYRAALGYASSRLGPDLIVELGIRELTIDAEDLDDVVGENLDLEISGIYFNLGLKF